VRDEVTPRHEAQPGRCALEPGRPQDTSGYWDTSADVLLAVRDRGRLPSCAEHEEADDPGGGQEGDE